MKRYKKLIPIFLVLMMLCSLIPASALEESPTIPAETTSSTVENSIDSHPIPTDSPSNSPEKQRELPPITTENAITTKENTTEIDTLSLESHRESKPLTIEAYQVTYGNTVETVTPQWMGDYENIILVENPPMMNTGGTLTITGTLSSPTATLEAADSFGSVYKVDLITQQFKITRSFEQFAQKSIDHVSGDACIYITLTDQGKETTYYLIQEKLHPSDTAHPVSSLVLSDAQTGNSLSELSANDLMVIHSQIRSLQVPKDTGALTVQLYSDLAFDSKGADYYPSSSSNRIVLNSKKSYFFDSVHARRTMHTKSPALDLQKGLNVLEVQCDPELLGTVNFKKDNNLSTVINSGYRWAAKGKYYRSYIYLLNWDGAGQTTAPGTNTDIDFIEAMSRTISNSTSYSTKLNVEKNTHAIILPEEMPKSNGKFDAAMIAGIRTADPAATYEIIVPENSYLQGNPKYPTVYQRRVGIYNWLYAMELDGTPIQSFEVEVTAADGKTKATHTVNFVRKNSSTAISTFNMTNATLEDGVSFSDKKNNYKFIPSDGASDITFSGNLPVGSSMMVGEKRIEVAEDGAFSVTIPVPQYSVRFFVTAPDGVTKNEYFFLRAEKDGTIPYFGIDQKTKELAEQMLAGYRKLKKQEREAQTANFASSYWSVFMAASAKESMDGGYTYDVTKHTFKQTTDYAAVILELIMLGENPYDFRGHNYVQEMVDNGGGPWACNIWYVMAAKAVGIDGSQFVDELKANAVNPTYDPDMRSWCIAALRGIVSDEDMANYADKLQERLIKSGDYIGEFYYQDGGEPNVNTQGCILSALATVGVDPEKHFAVTEGGKVYTPLATTRDRHMDENGMFCRTKGDTYGLNKDIIIALGDIINDGSVWDRCTLTRDKFDALVAKAESWKSDGKSTNEIDTAVSTAKAEAAKVSDRAVIGLGKAYYDLYEAMTAVDSTMKSKAKMGTPYGEFVDKINALPSTITISQKAAIKEAADFYDKWKQVIPQYWDEFVGNAALEKYHSSQKSILQLEGGEATLATFEKIMALPNALVITLNDKSQVQAARTAYDALTPEQKALITWTGATVLPRLTEAERMIAGLEGGGGSGDTPAIQTCTVSFRLIGDSKHGTGPHVAFEDWIPLTKYTFNAKSVTVGDVFLRALKDAKLEHKGASNNYISSIKGPNGWLGEFDNGPNSGWMYTVNGHHPSGGLNYDIVKNGDAIVWHYTDDYTKEEGSEKWGNKPYVPETEKGSEAMVRIDSTAKTDSTGKAKAALTEKEIKSALDKALEAAKKAEKDGKKNVKLEIQLDIKADNQATAIETSVPTSSVKELTKAEAVLSIKTPMGNLILTNKMLEEIGKAAAGKEVTFQITKIDKAAVSDGKTEALTEAQKKAAGEHTVYEVSILSGDKKITSFGSKKLSISLPYTLKTGEKAVGVGAWYLDDSGQLTKLTSSYDEKKKLVTFETDHLSCFIVGHEVTADASSGFTDVKQGQWYYESIMYLVDQGILSGTTKNTFSPNANITRAEFAQILYGMAKSQVGTSGSAITADSVKADGSGASKAFADVKSTAWYAKAVEWAYANGVVKGTQAADGKMSFSPNAKISRQDMSVMIQNYIQKVEKKAITEKNASISFADDTVISSYAKEAVVSMQKGGVISGIKAADGRYTFAPKANATRAEAATMIAKYLKK